MVYCYKDRGNEKMIEKDNPKHIFILLTRTATPFSRVIRFFTQCDYTHASLGLQENSFDFFSFGRKEAYTLPTSAGFINENLVEGILYRNAEANCILYKLCVSKEVYEEITKTIKTFELQYQQYRYSFLGVFLCYFNIPHTIKNRYFCSQFVAEVLTTTKALDINKNPSVYHPSDFLKEAKLECCYQGTLRELREQIQENSSLHTYYQA